MSNPRARLVNDILARMDLTEEQIAKLKRISEQLKGMTRAEGEQYAASVRRQCELTNPYALCLSSMYR